MYSPSTIASYKSIFEKTYEEMKTASIGVSKLLNLESLIKQAFADGFDSVMQKSALEMPANMGSLLTGGAVGAGLSAPLVYLMMKKRQAEQMGHTRNKAFGAGMAAGLVGPRILQGLNSRVQSMAGQPQGMPY